MALTQEQFMQLMGGKREPVTASLASVLDLIKKPLDYYAVDKRVPLVGGQSAADLIGLTGTQSLVQDFSQGKPMMRDGIADERFIEAAGMIPMIKPAAIGAGKAAKYLGKEALRQGYEGTGLLGKIAPDIKMPITTWHGSPNIFDKFDTNKIKNMASNGQSYGYGHYLAEKDNVAKGYQPRDPVYEDKLSKLYNNAEKQQNYPAMEIYERYMGHETPDDISKILNDKDSLSGYSVADIKKMQQANNLAAKEYQKQKSSLYKVDLPDEYLPKMLQWDKPLSEHPADIQKALQPIIANTKKSFPNMIDDPTGSSIYQLYSQYRGGNPDFASKSLLEAGIPGIKYFDDFSGGSGKGSHNYVVFDDNILKILERNSKPIK